MLRLHVLSSRSGEVKPSFRVMVVCFPQIGLHMRLVKLWTISSVLVFLSYATLNVFSDTLASEQKAHGANAWQSDAMSSTAQLVVWPMRPVSHPSTPDWAILLLVAGCCVGWGLPIACIVMRLVRLDK